MNKDSATIAQGESYADDSRTMGGSMLGADVDPVGLDPGIVKTVAWLRANGFKTTDSGDGRTKFTQGFTEDDGVCPYPHVAITVDPGNLVREADRLAQLLYDDHTIAIEPLGPGEEDPPRIEASYCAANGTALILLLHVDDSMLRPESCGS